MEYLDKIVLTRVSLIKLTMRWKVKADLLAQVLNVVICVEIL